MQTRRIIHIVIGWLFIILNLLSNLVRCSTGELKYDLTANGIGAIIGSHFLIFLGIWLLMQAKKIKKKTISKKDDKLLNEEIDQIGNNSNR